jgi:transcription elongation GreA/GreB family factor
VSRAFVKESDNAGEPLPELAISPNPKLVTPGGLRLVEARIATEARFRIVGEDEADPARGFVRFVSPLAKALLGKRVGDEVRALERAAQVVALESTAF